MKYAVLVFGYFLINCLLIELKAFHLGIINGQEVVPHSKPYQVYLKAEYIHFEDLCSGVIVSSKDILTTATCVMGSDYVTIYAGAHDITAEESTQLVVRGTDYRVPEEFDWNFAYNLAIIKLDEPLVFNEYIAPIEMNLNPDHLRGKWATVSGWGGESTEETVSPVLRETSALIVNNSVCTAHQFEMIDADICLSGLNGATSCMGDAGGPIVVDEKLIAISSPKEYECGKWRSFAGIMVHKFTKWLQENLEKEVEIMN